MHIARKTISLLLILVLMSGCLAYRNVSAQTEDAVESGVLTVLNHGGTNLLYVSTENASQTGTRPTANKSLQAVKGDGLISVVQSGVENKDTKAYLLHENGMYMIVFMYTGITFSVGDRVMIQGKFRMTYDDGSSYTVDMKKTTFECIDPTATGTSCWQIVTDYTQTSVNAIHSGVTKYANAEHGWHFYLRLSEKSGDIAYNSSLSGFKYSINDGDKKALTAFYASYSSGSLFFIMPELPETISENTTLTIYAGKSMTSDKYHGLELTNEIVLYGNQHGWSLNGFIIQTAYTDTAVNGIDSAATKYVNAEQGWHFYLKLSEKSGDIAYNSGLSGFEYSLNDGEKKPLIASYAGHLNGSLFFIMPELPEVITENTKLTIYSGQAITADEYYGLNLVSDVNLYGNQYGWSLENYLLPTETGVLGDVNGDSETNVKDLIHFKKSLRGNTTVNSQAKLTKNDSDIDEKDVSALRQILVATYHEEGIPYGMPTYVDNREIEMAAYMGPRGSGFNRYKNGEVVEAVATNFINDTEFQKYKEAGFTYLLAEADAKYGSETLRTYMQLAEKYDLDVVLMDDAINEMLQGNPEHPVNADIIAFRTNDMLANYPETFKGWMLRDEPPIAYLDYYTEVIAAIKKIDPRNYLYTACLPCHATIDNFTTDETVTDKGEAYTSYINSYGKLLGEFNYDLYPLQANNALRSDWLQNLALAAGTAKENGFPTGITLQSCEYYTNWGLKNRIPDDEQDIGFQMYTALSYGMRKINYFTYWEHYRQNTSNYYTASMVMYPTDGGTESITTKIYDAVKSVNTEIKKYDHVLMNYGWEGTLALGGATDGTTGYANSRIASCNATSDAVIGCMKDAIGYDGYMIANANNPATSEETTVTIQFNHATKAIVYIDGEREVVSLENGSYTVTVPIGEGIFVIPVI